MHLAAEQRNSLSERSFLGRITRLLVIALELHLNGQLLAELFFATRISYVNWLGLLENERPLNAFWLASRQLERSDWLQALI